MSIRDFLGMTGGEINEERRRFPLQIVGYGLLLKQLITSGGCVTVETRKIPDTPLKGPISEKFSRLVQNYPSLETQLRNLPDVRDGISPSDIHTLEGIAEIYHNNQRVFRDAFEQMMQIGKPQNKGYYNSPLEAAFFMVEDGKSAQLTPILHKYSLNDLIEKAWDFGSVHNGKGLSLPEDKAKEVVAGLNLNEADKRGFTYSEKGVRMVNRPVLIYNFLENPGIFSEKSRRIMQEGLKKYHSRWGDYDAVTSRLNSPELVDYYTQKSFTYRLLGYRGGNAHSAFSTRGGNCYQIEDFQQLCLKKAGYDARTLLVDPTLSTNIDHATTQFFVDGKMYIMDNGNPTPLGISGPCKSIKECGY